MNRIGPAYTQPTVNGDLLYKNYQHTDVLQIDLYGYIDSDGCNIVESVCVSGTNIEIAELFSGDALEYMGKWLDHKDKMDPTNQEWANRYKQRASRLPC